MFENVKPGGAGPGSAGEPEDMFADTETSASAAPAPRSPGEGGLPRPAVAPQTQIRSEAPSAPASYPAESASSGPRIPWKLLVVIFGAILIVGIAAALSYYLLVGRARGVPEAPEELRGESAAEEAIEVDTGTTEEADEAAPEAPVRSRTPAIEPDSDQDGLSDATEAALGTSVTAADTDDDGLFDREEVEVYETNPLNPDTDGDTFLDGAEVSNGYNPNGSGKLFEVPSND